jgi:hypothetical protein
MTSTKKDPARSPRVMRALKNGAALGVLAITVAGCVAYEPPPPPGAYYGEPAGGYYAAPAYYAQPCCYAYPEYYGPPVAVGVGFGGGRRYWR